LNELLHHYTSAQRSSIDWLDSRIISHANATAKKIVIVNDNSTDNTADIVLTFAKEHSFVTIVEKKIECHTLARK
jgi:cellulose synthase/poly-beta-1,6-N-acetylglucosamine synthase-like glycosyltransferase